MYKEEFYSSDCSVIIPNVAILSVQDLSLEKTACSSRSPLCILFFIHSIITLLSTFPAYDNSTVPRQVLYTCRSPFFGNMVRRPCFHALDSSSVSQTFSKRAYTMSAEMSRSALIASRSTPRGTGALPLFQMFYSLFDVLSCQSACGCVHLQWVW